MACFSLENEFNEAIKNYRQAWKSGRNDLTSYYKGYLHALNFAMFETATIGQERMYGNVQFINNLDYECSQLFEQDIPDCESPLCSCGEPTCLGQCGQDCQ